MKFKFLLIIFSLTLFSFRSDKPAYLIYNSKNKTSKWKSLTKDATKADIILFGELHDNPISHWLQYELAHYLIKNSGRNVVMGAEMFESDQQLIINEYLSGMVNERTFSSQARLWPNHKTDYAPLLRLALEEKVSFIATNIPRRYASIVHSGGFEALNDLDDAAKQYIAPLPPAYDADLPGYKAMMEMQGMGKAAANPNFPKAQAIKDATMAHFILENFTGEHIFIHINGSYHSDNYEGILWYLQRQEKDLNYVTISTVIQDDVFKLRDDFLNIADIILVVNRNMTTSY